MTANSFSSTILAWLARSVSTARIFVFVVGSVVSAFVTLEEVCDFYIEKNTKIIKVARSHWPTTQFECRIKIQWNNELSCNFLRGLGLLGAQLTQSYTYIFVKRPRANSHLPSKILYVRTRRTTQQILCSITTRGCNTLISIEHYLSANGSSLVALGQM